MGREREGRTIVRRAKDKTWQRRRYAMKEATREGLPSGCWNALAGSGVSQYSSSQSIGNSRSKLSKMLTGEGGKNRRILALRPGLRTAVHNGPTASYREIRGPFEHEAVRGGQQEVQRGRRTKMRVSRPRPPRSTDADGPCACVHPHPVPSGCQSRRGSSKPGGRTCRVETVPRAMSE